MSPFVPFLGLKMLVWPIQPTFKDEKSAFKSADIYAKPPAFY